ncbi:MAG: DUF4105 domain-containing protein [Deltaproteobacteria bacterium]|nr:DUF4105 domain-containing protein [Deltaproteobacteria bacterium]
MLLLAVILSALGRVPDDVEISLLTMGPGGQLWESAGHAGIRVRSHRHHRDLVYHWGVFDYTRPGFAPRFIAGDLRYSTIAVETLPYLMRYQGMGREVVEQDLDLSPVQREALIGWMEDAIQPENRDYDYRLLTRNCATKARDAIDHALDGRLREALQARPGHPARFHTRRLSRPLPHLWLGADLLLGAVADRPVDAWAEAMTPVTLHDAVAAVQISGSPLVRRERVLVPSDRTRPLGGPPPTWPPLAAALGIAAWAAVFSRRPRALAAVLLPAALLAGGAGLALWGVWATAHDYFQYNANALIFSPLWLGLVAAWRRPALALVLARAGVGLAALGAVVGLAQRQDNLPWVALGLILHGLALWAARGAGRG